MAESDGWKQECSFPYLMRMGLTSLTTCQSVTFWDKADPMVRKVRNKPVSRCWTTTGCQGS